MGSKNNAPFEVTWGVANEGGDSVHVQDELESL